MKRNMKLDRIIIPASWIKRPSKRQRMRELRWEQERLHEEWETELQARRLDAERDGDLLDATGVPVFFARRRDPEGG